MTKLQIGSKYFIREENVNSDNKISYDSYVKYKMDKSLSKASTVDSECPVDGIFQIQFEDNADPLKVIKYSDVKPFYWPRVYNESKNVFHYLANRSFGIHTFIKREVLI